MLLAYASNRLSEPEICLQLFQQVESRQNAGKNTRSFASTYSEDVITDMQGFLVGTKVHATSEHDNKAGWEVLRSIRGKYSMMRKLYADGGYRGKLKDREKVNSDGVWRLPCARTELPNSNLCQNTGS